MPKLIVLPSYEYLHECFSYNSETGVLTWKRRPLSHFRNEARWKIFNTRFAGKIAGSPSACGHLFVRVNDILLRVHRIIYKMTTGEEPPITIDHRDIDPANNSIENLRSATKANQNWNRDPPKNNTSGYVGVYRDRTRWSARIEANGVAYNLGYFATREEAAAARDAAARRLYGEFYRPPPTRK